jgi:hypothetical protein
MQDRPTERVRVLLDGLNASAIVDRVHPYYSGYQFEGEWLDTLKESIEGELDDLDRIIRGRAGTVGAVDRLREYVANAPASSMGEMARAIVRNYCDTIEVEAGDPTGARRFAERLEAAAAERADVTLFGVDYMALPLDADGEAIHAGDVLDGYGKTIEVVELRHGRSGWVLISRDGNGYADCAAFAHHHATTVEDLLREYALKCEEAGNSGPEVKRIATEYAARLMLAGEDA